jgi:hypothetical protein
MEPVAVAARSATEVWVVNHLSDSISIVDLSGAAPASRGRSSATSRATRLRRTGGGRAFVTTAHRGQQRISTDLAGVPGAGDPQLATAGVGRADVWVFDTANPGPGIGGKPLAIVTLFGDTPRALATSPDGNTVYAAVFKSGNQTTAIGEGAVCNGFDDATPCTTPQGFDAGRLPPPSTNALGQPAPETGLIVKYDQGPPVAGRARPQLEPGRTLHPPDQDVRDRCDHPRQTAASPAWARRCSTWP